MISLNELKNALETLQVPVAYHHFRTGQAPSPPFLVYYEDQDIEYYADDKVYLTATAVTVELYTNEKNIALEESLKALLKDLGILFHRYETWIESEKLYMEVFEFELQKGEK
ncbi:hypothetical protein SAMN04515656_1128 [Eubacterium aggregans]|uniref:Uncharacterized protein n=1 Tax=Eubacterium aggregans TaxID=81409 RepID=A0A1H4BN94_9FIRM|nr:hypothetical protein [Eubacterium aggregans]SEA49518.1 hypothetical protein SAMN04515656_1128 [Eubacterium aggregans]